MVRMMNPNESEELDLDSWNDTSVATINKPMNLAPGEFPSPHLKALINYLCDFRRTATTLPLPVTSDSSRPRIDYICFLIDFTSRDSLKTVEESLKHVDVRYFLGKCCFVALKVKNPEKRAIFIEQIAQLSQQYKSDVLYGSFETEAESAFLAEQILKSVEIAAGLQKNKSPMFLECCRFPVAGEESAE
eukprot:XP_011416396.1 PREDICTED: centromere protein M [Crassostrea gigas]